MTRLPTGPRSGLLDLATNQPLTLDGPFPLEVASSRVVYESDLMSGTGVS
ncbi:hypothetical protein [Mycobacteroides chelonae]|nr:hypothetical protein [Mycobacteroides chelonae]